VTLPGDADQLFQVFTNLIENAIKYGGQRAEITVGIERNERDPVLRAPAVRIWVDDRGPGIDPIHIPRLTERFYRVDTHRSRELGGTGLGLAIVKHIVNRHRGRLRIDSVPGEGSTFTVILPTVFSGGSWPEHPSTET
jgi:two-component system phosphate regulon sensor histidine kinase PhoR